MTPETTMLETSKVPGTSVYNTAQEEIGVIDDLVVDTTTGKVRYAFLSFGGLLGIGRTSYVIPWTALKWDAGLNGYVTGVTVDQLQGSPDFAPGALGNRSWEQMVHANYGAPTYWELEHH